VNNKLRSSPKAVEVAANSGSDEVKRNGRVVLAHCMYRVGVLPEECDTRKSDRESSKMLSEKKKNKRRQRKQYRKRTEVYRGTEGEIQSGLIEIKDSNQQNFVCFGIDLPEMLMEISQDLACEEEVCVDEILSYRPQQYSEVCVDEILSYRLQQYSDVCVCNDNYVYGTICGVANQDCIDDNGWWKGVNDVWCPEYFVNHLEIVELFRKWNAKSWTQKGGDGEATVPNRTAQPFIDQIEEIVEIEAMFAEEEASDEEMEIQQFEADWSDSEMDVDDEVSEIVGNMSLGEYLLNYVGPYDSEPIIVDVSALNGDGEWSDTMSGNYPLNEVYDPENETQVGIIGKCTNFLTSKMLGLVPDVVYRRIMEGVVGHAIDDHMSEIFSKIFTNAYLFTTIMRETHSWFSAFKISSLVVAQLVPVQNLDALMSVVFMLFDVVAQTQTSLTNITKVIAIINSLFLLRRNVVPMLERILQLLSPDLFALYNLHVNSAAFDLWSNQIVELHHDIQTFTGNTERVRLARELVEQSRTFLFDVNSSRLPQQMIATYRALQNKVDDIVHALQSLSCKRVEPFCFQLVGSPGVGKSTMVVSLAQRVAGVLLHKDPHSVSVYTRGTTKFWDRYVHQDVVILDDAFSQVDDPSTTDFLNLVSNTTMVLDMASIPDKGTVFDSRVVGMTSNIAYPQPNGFLNHEAIWRRRHALIAVEEDKNGVLQFRFMDPMQNSYITAFMPLDEMIHKLIELAQSHEVRCVRANVFQDQVLDIRARRYEEPEELAETNPFGDGEAQGPGFDYPPKYQSKRVYQLTEVLDGVISFTRNLFGIGACVTEDPVDEYVDIPSTDPFACYADEFEEPTKMGRAAYLKYLWTQYTIKRKMLILGGAGAIAVAVVAGFVIVRLLATKETNEPQVETLETVGPFSESGPMGSAPSYPRRVRVQAGVYEKEAERKIDAPVVSNVDAKISSLMRSNLHAFVVAKSHEFGTAVAVGGGDFIIPYHYVYNLTAPTLFIMYDAACTPIRVHLSKNNVVMVGEDLCMFRVPNIVSRNIVKHFITKQQLEDCGEYISLAKLVTVSNRVGKELVPSLMTMHGVTKRKQVTYYDDVGGGMTKKFTLTKSWEYPSKTVKGWCGSLLVGDNCKLLGVHVAGNVENGVGWSTVVTSEMLLEARERAKTLTFFKANIDGLDDPEISKKPTMPLTGFDLKLVQTVQRGIFAQGRTSYYHSDLHGEYLETKQPSVLTKNDIRLEIAGSPLLRGLEKYNGGSIPVPESMLLEAVDVVSDMLRHRDDNFFKCFGEMTDFEVVNGRTMVVDGKRVRRHGYEGVAVNKSAGYPYCLEEGCVGSKLIFLEDQCDDGLWYKTRESFLDEVKEQEQRVRDGKRLQVYFTATLKDELRPIAKIKAGKTRVFMASSKLCVYLARKYFGDFLAWMRVYHGRCFSAVGLNVHGPMWTQMWMRMMNNSSVGFAGDYTNWDGSLSASFMLAVCEVVNRWYGDCEGNQEMRRALFLEFINSRFLVFNGVFEKNRGMPSGCVGTSEFNSVANQIVFLCAWKCLARENEPACVPMTTYKDNVVSFFYGDDNIHSVKKKWFNANNCGLVLKKFGLELTSESKMKELDTVNDALESHTFMKREWRRHRSGLGYVAPLELDVIFQMVMWCRRGEPKEVCELQTCRAAVTELFHHGESVYLEHTQKIKNALALVDVELNVPSFESMEEMWCAGFNKSFVDTQGWFLPEDARRCYLTSGMDASRRNIDLSNVCQNESQSGSFGVTRSRPAKNESKNGGFIHQNAAPTREFVGRDASINVAGVSTNENIEEMCSRMTLVEIQPWSTTDPVGFLTKISFPSALITNPVFSLLNSNVFVRGGMRLRVTCSGTPVHQGQLVVYWSPVGDVQPARSSLEVMPRIIVNASDLSSQELIVPFENPRFALSAYDTTSGAGSTNQFGTLTFVVRGALKAATGSTTTLNIAVHAAIYDGHFEIPKQTTTPNWAQSGVVLGDIAEGAVMNSVGRKKAKPGPIAKFADGVVETLGGVVVSGARKFVSTMLGDLDHPLEVDPAPLNMLGDTYHSSGGHKGIRMENDQRQMASVPKTLDTAGADEMDLREIAKIPSFFKTVNWAAAASGNLYTFPVTPDWFFTQRTIATVNYADTTPLCAITNPFEFWRGTIEILFEFLATPYHQGRVSVYYMPGYYSSTIPSAAVLANAIQWHMDLTESKLYRCELPFYASTPYKHVLGIGPTSNVVTLAAERYATGMCFVQITNPLSASSSVAQNVDINFYVAGGSDFEVQYLRDSADFLYRTLRQTQSGVLDDDEEEAGFSRAAQLDESVPVSLPVERMPLKIGDPKSMLLQHHLRRVFRRYDVVPLANHYSVLAVSPFSDPRSSDITNWLEYFASMYMFWRGPIRFAAYTDFISSERAFKIVQPSGTSAADSASNLPVASLDIAQNGFFLSNFQNPYIDFVSPYASHHKFCFTMQDLGALTIPMGGLLVPSTVRVHHMGSAGCATKFFAGLADETRFFRFIGLPLFEIK